jgi:hypothetical protein
MNESTQRATVRVSVEPEKATRFNVGTRWKVVASSLGSLWEGAHTITLEEIEAEGDEK